MDLAMEETLNTKDIQEILDYIKGVSHKNFKREICGFVGYAYEQEEYIAQHEENISPDPSSYFLINPLSYLLFKDKYEMVGIFHSHIIGDETESEFDVKMSDNCCQPFLIYSLNSKKINIYTPKTVEANVNILERIKEIV
tara:strand:- start:5 stop:424 length:420 start_codon:yes stop_codon:yes gene_type:complete